MGYYAVIFDKICLNALNKVFILKPEEFKLKRVFKVLLNRETSFCRFGTVAYVALKYVVIIVSQNSLGAN